MDTKHKEECFIELVNEVSTIKAIAKHYMCSVFCKAQGKVSGSTIETSKCAIAFTAATITFAFIPLRGWVVIFTILIIGSIIANFLMHNKKFMELIENLTK